MEQVILQALTAEVRHLQDALNNIGAYVFIKDIEGRYLFANAMVCELFGRPLADIVGCADEDFFDLEASDELRRNDLQVTRDGIALEGEEINVMASTGEARIYWSAKRPIRDNKGQIVGLCGVSTDITERRSLEETVKKQQALLDTVLDNVDSYIYLKDPDRRYLYVNAKVCRLLGRRSEEILGKEDSELVSREIAEGLQVHDHQVFQEGKEVTGEEIFPDPKGELRHYWTVKLPLISDGQIQSMVGISTDITEVVKLREQFKLLANTDALTDVFSRRHWMERAEHELKRARRNATCIAVMVLDIDRFKNVNDENGHLTGDKAIQAVAQTCRGVLRSTDLLGRLGGDEFVVLLPDSSVEGATRAAQRLQSALCLTVSNEDGADVSVTSSLGVAISDGPTTIDELVARADSALYQAKRAGRNQTHISAPREEAKPAHQDG